MAVNVAIGCTNCCSDCYGPLASKTKREDWCKVRLPKTPPVNLVREQIEKGMRPQGVFISFFTDPFLDINRFNTEALVLYLLEQEIPVATLSKVDVMRNVPAYHGMTLVSPHEAYKWTNECHAADLLTRRSRLKMAHLDGYITWVSMEPYPPPAVFEQKLDTLLNDVHFVDFIIFGKRNYDPRANTEEARIFYRDAVAEFRDYCKDMDIRHHVKTDTLKFIGEA